MQVTTEGEKNELAVRVTWDIEFSLKLFRKIRELCGAGGLVQEAAA